MAAITSTATKKRRRQTKSSSKRDSLQFVAHGGASSIESDDEGDAGFACGRSPLVDSVSSAADECAVPSELEADVVRRLRFHD
jgi:hypothetical protein